VNARRLGWDSKRLDAASFLGLRDGWYDVSVLVSGGVIEIVDIEGESAPCDDCGLDTFNPDGQEWYMVTGATWEQVAANAKFLCVGCLEGRLGRLLTPADFAPFPINDRSALDSDRLADRKGHQRT
jgi:hypothetical protein